MQAVAYLALRPEVDPKRIATVGYSMGSFVTGITGAIDPQIHAVLLSGGGDYDGVGPGYFDANKLPCQSPPFLSLRILGDRGAILYDLNADRGPMFLMNGLADTVMDATPEALVRDEATGFMFGPATPEALSVALKDAVKAHAHPKTWRKIMLRESLDAKS